MIEAGSPSRTGSWQGMIFSESRVALFRVMLAAEIVIR
jgi:hypothetical protein